MRRLHQPEDGKVMRSLRVGRVAGRRKRQGGAEIVEFTITLLLWFTVFLLIINMAIAVYDKAAVTNALRYAARQATLYWEDPSARSDTTPIANKRMKRSMITTAVDYWASTVIAPGGGSINITPAPTFVRTDGTVGTWTSAGDSGWHSIPNASVNLGLSYDHDFIGFTGPIGLLDVLGWTLGSQITASSEARL